MTSTLDWMGRKVSEIEARAFERGLNKAVQHLLSQRENWDKVGDFNFRVELDRLTKEILDLKDGN